MMNRGLHLRFLYILVLGLLFGTDAWADHPTAAFGSEASGPINTIAATPMPRGQWSIGLRTEVINFDEFSDAELEGFAAQGLEDVHSVNRLTSTSLAVAYGITEDVTVSVRIPYVDRKNIREGELEGGVPEAHSHGDSSGIGDAVVLGQYRLMQRPGLDSALLFGVKAPTGKTSNTDNGVRLDTEFQPGTGAWDFLIGAAVSKQTGRVGYHGNVLYNKTTEGSQDTEIGDAFFYNAAFSYRLSGEDGHTAHTHLQWDILLELNGETRQKNKIAGAREANTGGTVIYLSPGLRLSSGSKWSAFLSIGLPVTENLNGEQAGFDYRIVAGVSMGL